MKENSNITERAIEIYIDRLYYLLIKNKKEKALSYTKVAKYLRLLPQTVTLSNTLARLEHRIYLFENNRSSTVWSLTAFVTLINLLVLTANLLGQIDGTKGYIILSAFIAALGYYFSMGIDSGKKKEKMNYYKFVLTVLDRGSK